MLVGLVKVFFKVFLKYDFYNHHLNISSLYASTCSTDPRRLSGVKADFFGMKPFLTPYSLSWMSNLLARLDVRKSYRGKTARQFTGMFRMHRLFIQIFFQYYTCLHTKKRYSNDDCRNDILDSIETLLKKSNKNYFSSILQVYIPGTADNSTSHNISCERSTRTVTGAKVSGVLASKIWHELSDAIRSSDSLSCFKKNLKLFLFCQAFTS